MVILTKVTLLSSVNSKLFANDSYSFNMQQAVRIANTTAFFLQGEVIEYASAEQLFSIPKDKRTEDYITRRFG